ncbi:recombinase family protein [Bacillus pacificus]
MTKQRDILLAHGVVEDKIEGDVVSSTKKERKGFEKVNRMLEEGDELVVVELTRLARSMRELVNIVHDFKERGIKLRSLQDDLDLDTANGMMMFNMLALMAEFERLWIQERTKRSLSVARARGRVGGRKKTDPGKLKKAVRMYESKQMTVREIQEITGVSKSVLYDHLKELKKKEEGE